MVLTIIANINAKTLLKPKKHNKLMQMCNPPIDPALELIRSKVDHYPPEGYKKMCAPLGHIATETSDDKSFDIYANRKKSVFKTKNKFNHSPEPFTNTNNLSVPGIFGSNNSSMRNSQMVKTINFSGRKDQRNHDDLMDEGLKSERKFTHK